MTRLLLRLIDLKVHTHICHTIIPSLRTASSLREKFARDVADYS